MKLAIIQFHTRENVPSNIKRMESLLLSIQADCIVLPELWLCPYDNEQIQNAKSYAKQAREMLSHCAKMTHCWIIGGTLPYDDYNMCFIFNRDGEEVCHYAKSHLLEVHANHTYYEADVFKPGNSFCTFETEFGKMGILVCYDIRFPEMARILAQSGIQVLFLPAAFNEQVGTCHWKPLLQTRAMENEIFLVGVNPEYTYKKYQAYGHSIIVDPFGTIVHESVNEVEMADIDLDQIKKIRQRMPFWSIRRTDLYEIKEK